LPVPSSKLPERRVRRWRYARFFSFLNNDLTKDAALLTPDPAMAAPPPIHAVGDHVLKVGFDLHAARVFGNGSGKDCLAPLQNAEAILSGRTMGIGNGKLVQLAITAQRHF
jgi:hypothetical protein